MRKLLLTCSGLSLLVLSSCAGISGLGNLTYKKAESNQHESEKHPNHSAAQMLKNTNERSYQTESVSFYQGNSAQTDLSAGDQRAVSDYPTTSFAPEDSCDFVVLANGEEFYARVTEISEELLRYKKCENLNGPTYSMSRSKVLFVRYVNGTKEILNPTVPKPTISVPKVEQPRELSDYEKNALAERKRKTDQFGLAGFVLGIVGVVTFFTLVPPLLGLIMSAIGLRDGYTTYNGNTKGYAIAGLVLSLLGVIGFVITVILWL